MGAAPGSLHPVNEFALASRLSFFLWSTIPDDALLSAATFEVRFTDGRKPRPVTIRHGNRATYTRDTDADLIEAFLRGGGFVKGGGHALVAVA